MSKELRYAGFSILADGTYKFRTASDEKRIQQLIKFGEQVSMVLLDKPVVSKSEAAKALLAQGDRWIPEAQALFVAMAQDDNPFVRPKATRTVKVRVSARSAQQMLTTKTPEPDYTDPGIKLSPKQAAKIRAEFMKRLRAVYEAN